MTYTVPGKLQKQGPIATLAGGIEFGYYDKFLFNGEQFVQYVATMPGVIEASAHVALRLSDVDNVTKAVSFSEYRDSSGEFRFTNGTPIHDGGQYSGIPSESYDHVIIGYDGPVTTSSLKFWSTEYIPVELIRVDYGYDSNQWYNIPTHEGNVTFEFDANLKVYESEVSPTGQYVYTVIFGQSYTANYWRIRSFVGLHTMSTVENFLGKNLTVTTTSGLPANSGVYEKGKLYLAYGGSSTWQAPGGALGHVTFESSGVDCVTWGSYSTDTTGPGVESTVSGVLLDWSAITGDVTLPGWVNTFEMDVYEDYPKYIGSQRELKNVPMFPFTEIREYSPNLAYVPNNWSNWEWYKSVRLNCYYTKSYVYGHLVRNYYGDCWDVFPVFDFIRKLYSHVESTEPFYLSSTSTPFDIVTGCYFTDYESGDIGEEGELIRTSVYLNTVSGTDAPPPGDPVVTVNYGYELSYAGKTSTVLQTMGSSHFDASDDLYSGMLLKYTYPMNLTQVKVLERNVALFKFWESDGSIAVTNEIDDEYIFDVVYDSSDDVFYSAIYSDTTAAGSIDDNFGSTMLSSARWDLAGGGITLDTVNSGIVFKNTTYGNNVYGRLTSNYYYTGSFAGTLPVEVYTCSGIGYYGLSCVDKQYSNTAAFVGVTGDWGEVSTRSVVGVTISEYIDIADHAFYIKDVTPDPAYIPEGVYNHEFTYISSAWYYSRTEQGHSICDVCQEDVGSGPLLSVSGVSLVLNSSSDIPVSDYSSVTFVTNKVVDTNITTSGIDLEILYDNPTSEFVLSYNDSVDNTLISGVLNSLYSYEFSPRISGKTFDYINVFSDEYSSVGGALTAVPSLSIVATDNDGHRTEVTGVTDTNGVVIASLEALDGGRDFASYRGKISLTTTQTTEAQGGSLFIKVEDDFYKYNKTSLPLGVEGNANTAIYVFDYSLDNIVYNLNYDLFVNGGLHYIVYDDDRDMVVLKEMSSATFGYVPYVVELDVSSVHTPMALDSVDLNNMFVVENNNVYVMNMDADSVAFCSVVAEDPIIPADSGYNTTINAFVTNLYGDPLQNKLVTFSVTAGGGAISPATYCTTSSGTASTTYTADEVVGTTIITATASNDTC